MSNSVEIRISKPSLCECGSKGSEVTFSSEDTWDKAGIQFICPVCDLHIQHTWLELFSFLFPLNIQGVEEKKWMDITDQLK